MEGKIDLIGNFAADWIKYNNYDLRETPAGDVYLVPASDASYTMYNPFNVAEDLIIDLISIGDKALKLGKDINRQEKDDLDNEVLIFAKKYGLLGLISASVYNKDIVGDEIVLLTDNNLISEKKTMAEDNYLKLFIPFAQKEDITIRKYKKSVDIIKREDSPKYYGKRPVVLDLVFSKFYTEQVKWIIDFAKMIASHFNQLLIYKKSASHLTENVTIMAGKFQAQKIGFTIDQLDKTFISWKLNSLKTTIETIYAFAVTDDSTLIDRCKFCQDVFIANNTRTKYCSISCRNRANVQKSRERKARSGK